MARVTIDEQMNYYVAFGNERERCVAFEDITPFLRDAQLKEPTMYVALYADESVPYREIVRVLDIATHENFKMVLATRPMK